jgi:hypothetical protein
LTGDLARTLALPEDDHDFLIYNLSRALSSKPFVVPLDPNPTQEQLIEGWQTARKRLATEPSGGNPYDALGALVKILRYGRAKTKGSRTPGGPLELIDPTEFTRLRVVRTYAVNKRSEEIIWYGLQVSARDLLDQLQRSRPEEDDNKEASADDRRVPRLEYLGMLEQLVAALGDKFRAISDDAVARRLIDQHKAQIAAGKTGPRLPHRRRIETQVKKIRERRLARASGSTDRSDT